MKHSLLNKSIETIDFHNWLKDKKAYVFYSDPPWSDGNLKYWATLNNRQTGNKFKRGC